MEQLLLKIIYDKNYEDELAYAFNLYKDDIDPMQFRMEAFSISNIFQASNCTNFSDIPEHLEPLHPTERARIPNLLSIAHPLLINPVTSWITERSFSVARRIKTWLCSTMATNLFNSVSILHLSLWTTKGSS